MTQFECEMALIRIAEAAAEIIRMHNPEINHTSISIGKDGFINISGAKFEGTKLIEGDLLDAVKYRDGVIEFHGEAREGAA